MNPVKPRHKIKVIHWNPRQFRKAPSFHNYLTPWRRVNNFGDLLGPAIVAELLRTMGLRDAIASRRLLTVGSILNLASPGDVVWGSGVNGKSLERLSLPPTLDIRAVRGPLTRNALIDQGLQVPEVFGDPGLLTGILWPRDTWYSRDIRRPFLFVPNLNDWADDNARENFIHPSTPLHAVIAAIANADFVAGSSLHAIVVADSFGIPSRLIRSAAEPAFKYLDYYRGSGRDSFNPAYDEASARSMMGEPAPDWDPSGLLASFPSDLWTR